MGSFTQSLGNQNLKTLLTLDGLVMELRGSSVKVVLAGSRDSGNIKQTLSFRGVNAELLVKGKLPEDLTKTILIVDKDAWDKYENERVKMYPINLIRTIFKDGSSTEWNNRYIEDNKFSGRSVYVYGKESSAASMDACIQRISSFNGVYSPYFNAGIQFVILMTLPITDHKFLRDLLESRPGSLTLLGPNWDIDLNKLTKNVPLSPYVHFRANPLLGVAVYAGSPMQQTLIDKIERLGGMPVDTVNSSTVVMAGPSYSVEEVLLFRKCDPYILQEQWFEGAGNSEDFHQITASKLEFIPLPPPAFDSNLADYRVLVNYKGNVKGVNSRLGSLNAVVLKDGEPNADMIITNLLKSDTDTIQSNEYTLIFLKAMQNCTPENQQKYARFFKPITATDASRESFKGNYMLLTDPVDSILPAIAYQLISECGGKIFPSLERAIASNVQSIRILTCDPTGIPASFTELESLRNIEFTLSALEGVLEFDGIRKLTLATIPFELPAKRTPHSAIKTSPCPEATPDAPPPQKRQRICNSETVGPRILTSRHSILKSMLDVLRKIMRDSQMSEDSQNLFNASMINIKGMFPEVGKYFVNDYSFELISPIPILTGTFPTKSVNLSTAEVDPHFNYVKALESGICTFFETIGIPFAIVNEGQLHDLDYYVAGGSGSDTDFVLAAMLHTSGSFYGKTRIEFSSELIDVIGQCPLPTALSTPAITVSCGDQETANCLCAEEATPFMNEYLVWKRHDKFAENRGVLQITLAGSKIVYKIGSTGETKEQPIELDAQPVGDREIVHELLSKYATLIASHNKIMLWCETCSDRILQQRRNVRRARLYQHETIKMTNCSGEACDEKAVYIVIDN